MAANSSKNSKKIVFIGGTGSALIGSAAKDVKNWEVTLLVSLVDDGGSGGRLRNTLQIPPMGDIKKALIALSQKNENFLKAFDSRFEAGELKGHTMGNIFLAGLFLEYKSINQMMETAGELLAIKGQVLTTTLENLDMSTLFENGTVLEGENTLDENRDDSLGRPQKYSLKQDKPANPLAVQAIVDADLIVFGPGDLGANTIVPLLTSGIQKALNETPAKLVYIANLMTKNGETDKMNVNDCVNLIEEHLTRPVDYVLLNDAELPTAALTHYQKAKEFPMPFVKVDLEKDGRQVISADLLDKTIHEKSKADVLRRSLLRHHGEKVVSVLKKLI